MEPRERIEVKTRGSERSKEECKVQQKLIKKKKTDIYLSLFYDYWFDDHEICD